MTDLIPFTSPNGATLRTLSINGDPWLLAPDICRSLGLHDTTSAMKMVDELDKTVLRRSDTPHFFEGIAAQVQTINIVNESGMYAMVFQSNRPEAKVFQRWVTHDVLPQIRKTGAFIDPSKITRKDLALMVFEAEERLEIESAARLEAEAYAKELEPSANAWDVLADARGDYGVADAAKVLSRDPAIATGERRLFAFMAAQGWVSRRGRRWRAYQTQVDNGRLVEKVNGPFEMKGEMVTPAPTVRITPKGLRELHRLFGGSAEAPSAVG